MQKLDEPRMKNAFIVELRNRFDILSNAADLDESMNVNAVLD
jgi:hypothetical protein